MYTHYMEEKEVNNKTDWALRVRDAIEIVLTEGDILVMQDIYYHVASGEVTIYASGKVDSTNGDLAEVSREAIPRAIAEGKEIFNLKDVG